MPTRHVGHLLLAIEQAKRLLRAAVDGIDQIEIADAEVVLRVRLDEHLFNRGGCGVASGLGNRYRRRLVVERVDRVLRGRRQPLAGWSIEFDVIEAVALDLERADERRRRSTGGIGRQRRFAVISDHDLAAGRAHRRHRAQAHFGSLQDRDIAAILDLLRRQSGVCREVVFELEPLHVWQFDDVQRVMLRVDAIGFDEVFDGRREVEQHPFVLPFVAAQQRHPLVGRVGRLAHHQRGLIRVEARQLRADALVGAARDGDVAGGHLDAVRRRRFDIARDDEQGGQGMAQVGGAEREQCQRGDGDRGQRCAVAPDRCPLDAAAVLHVPHFRHRGFDEAANEGGGIRRTAAAAPGFHGADDRGLQRRLVFLEVERDLLVAGAAHQRTHQQVADQPGQREADDDPEGDDGPSGEAPRLQAVGREQQHEHAQANDAECASQRQLHPPAAPHLVDDVHELGIGIRAPIFVGHGRTSPDISLAPALTRTARSVATKS